MPPLRAVPLVVALLTGAARLGIASRIGFWMYASSLALKDRLRSAQRVCTVAPSSSVMESALLARDVTGDGLSARPRIRDSAEAPPLERREPEFGVAPKSRWVV